MLDALSDFWKPMKKSQAQEKLRPELMQIGSTIGFGFVPQASLTGRRLTVVGVNTYKFGEESLTSFVLAFDQEPAVSMIIAEAEGEQYLAISRRISISDRMKMFDSLDLDNVIEKSEVTHLACKDNIPDFKGWMVASYKREILGMKGAIYKGDYRKASMPAGEAQEFRYSLLVSDSNEHAIEIEKYDDGRIEVYATIYRRLSDIGEISHPPQASLNRPDLKLASSKSEEKTPAPPLPVVASAPQISEATHTVVEVVKPEAKQEPKAAPIKLPELTPTQPKVESKPAAAAEPVKPTAQFSPTMNAAVTPKKEEKPMAMNETMNGANSDMKPKLSNVMSASAQPSMNQEVKAVSKPTMNGMDNEAIECDLKVANKIIDEAIRNEMRLSDVVRRIIELPVAHQEAVHIPVTLSDEDYALLGIRYGMQATDRNSIKRRIMEDLNSFSGTNKKAA